ncbi:MAG TPA: addiction module toxin RelE [Rhodospirillaceae bacterium]|nr:addiction module toxin RelE [Rhodospirillaceae bacterium]
MKVVQTPTFAKAAKKLHANQKKDLDTAVKTIMADPSVGDKKAGELAGVLVFKFKMVKQLTLLAYSYEENVITLTLLALGSHENFYRDLKRS